MPATLAEFLGAEDPLSDVVLEMLLGHREENVHVDFKLEFHSSEEREWLEITKDVLAFANTDGGYLLFGVRDKTFEPVGLERHIADALCDINNLQQKINRHVEPQLIALRAKSLSVNGKIFVAIYIPPSLGKTHFVAKNAAFKYPSGGEKVVLQQGTTYVRRSGSNHLMDARDFDEIVNRRIEFFKESLLSKIARVVEAPQTSEVLVVSADPTAEAHTKFIIQNAPDAIPVKGMSFSVSPATVEQEVAAWIAMTGSKNRAVPPGDVVWRWYGGRRTIELGQEQRLYVAFYSLLTGAPAFYWLRGIQSREIRPFILEAMNRRVDVVSVCNSLAVGAFLGKRFHKTLLSELGNYADGRLSDRERMFPTNGPRSYFRAFNTTTKSGRYRGRPGKDAELEAELDQIVANGTHAGRQPELIARYRAQTIDCFLYAQDDQYAGAE